MTLICGDEQLHDSIVVSIPACHAGDRGSIPRRGVLFYLNEGKAFYSNRSNCIQKSYSEMKTCK